MRLQLRTGLPGTLLAPSLADGAAFVLASKGSSSPDAEANTAKAAAKLARLHTSAKTAPAIRGLQELRLNLYDCMMYSDRVMRARLSRKMERGPEPFGVRAS